MKKLFLFALMSALLSACNTINGIGQDVTAGGQAVSHAAQSVKSQF